MSIGNIVKRVVKLAVTSGPRYAKAGMAAARTAVKTTAKNAAAAAKKIAQVAAKNKKTLLTIGALGGVGVGVTLGTKTMLENQKIQINAFVDTKVNGDDCTTIIIQDKGVFPVGSKIYFELDTAPIKQIITTLLKSGRYSSLELQDDEINVYVKQVLDILTDKKDTVVSTDDNNDVVTTIDSFNPTMTINGIEKENEIQLYDLLTECAKQTNIFLRIEVTIGQALLSVPKAVEDQSKSMVEKVLTLIIQGMSVIVFIFTFISLMTGNTIGGVFGIIGLALIFYFFPQYFFKKLV